jgi:hypothetical protein
VPLYTSDPKAHSGVAQKPKRRGSLHSPPPLKVYFSGLEESKHSKTVVEEEHADGKTWRDSIPLRLEFRGKNFGHRDVSALGLSMSEDLQTPLSSAQLNPTQPNPTQLNSTQPNPTQPNSTQPNSTQLNSTQLNSTQLNSTQLNSVSSDAGFRSL